ncbi:hypothetical protein CAP36_00185 [Chitinophagaceae bacterium IBVUCB2]|nr:hypothetical protein CAP36_00185 [Chitinophagaceae bacterium IBVUCB2]
MKKFIIISILVVAGLLFILITLPSKKPSTNGFSSLTISTPFTFKSAKAEQLSIEAFDLKEAKKYDEAIHLYREAIKIEPDNPKLFFDLSDCYALLDKLEEAISLLDTAITLDGSYAPFYNNRGLYHNNLYEEKKSIVDFKKAIELDPNNYVYYSNMALSYYYDKDFLNACEAFEISKGLDLSASDINSSEGLKELNVICK